MFKFTNVDLYWAFLDEVNQLSGKYQVDLCNLSDAQVARLEEEGIKVRTKGDDRGYFVTCKSTKFPITAYDKNGNEVRAKVANESKADVLIKPYPWKSPTGAKGVSAGIAKLVITDLKEYQKDVVEEIGDDADIEVL
jgi:hypothetical protein